MAESSDEIIKREIADNLGMSLNGFSLLVYPQSSNEDQKIFGEEGGLTFGLKGVPYGSCDAAWTKKEKWVNPYNGKTLNIKPYIALEGTDALSRGSSGNAQYQRFHHALGAVKAGIIGVYYLKKGNHKIQPDLYGMAYHASKIERGYYFIIDDLDELRDLINSLNNEDKLKKFIDKKLASMYKIYKEKFDKTYSDWEDFANKRSTIIEKNYVIKYSGRMKRNFTDGSQRAGHIAVGEMFLTKYFFPKKKIYYLWPKMTSEDREYLDKNKSNDKEWKILRNEPNVKILTIDDLSGVPVEVIKKMKEIKDDPLKGDTLKIFRENLKIIVEGLKKGKISII